MRHGEAVAEVGRSAAGARVKRGRRMPTLYERLKPFAGAIKGLPPDLSDNHDHYLYGAAKRR